MRLILALSLITVTFLSPAAEAKPDLPCDPLAECVPSCSYSDCIVDECSEFQIDWDYCPGNLVCVEVENVAARCVRDPCTSTDCGLPCWPLRQCSLDDLVGPVGYCSQFLQDRYCQNAFCAGGDIWRACVIYVPAGACVSGINGWTCYNDKDACVGISYQVPVCADVPCYRDACLSIERGY